MKTDILIHDYKAIVRTDGHGDILEIYATKPRMRWMKPEKIESIPDGYDTLANKTKEFEHKPIES